MALYNVWDCTMVDHTIIVMDPATRKAEGEKRYRKALAAQVNQHFGPQRSYIRVAIAQGQVLGVDAAGMDQDRQSDQGPQCRHCHG